jgi:DNA repair protein RecN (Recombination protein N)
VLEEIRVRDLALIEDALLELGPGMTALTGETGAGKTALVGAIKLVIGERADSTLVRAGTDQAVVEGRLALDGREHVVRRTVSAEGRSRCTVDGDMVGVRELAERFGPVFDLHGQHEHQALLDTGSHVDYLDRYAGAPAESALAEYRVARGRYLQAVRKVTDIGREVAETAEKAEYLRFVIDEIERVDPMPGEDEALRARMPALIHSEKLTESAAEGHAALSGEAGVEDSLGHALAALGRVGSLDPALDEIAGRLEAVQTEVADAASALRAYAEGLEHDPAALEEAQRRLAVLEDLQKKHGASVEAVIHVREKAIEDLERLEHGDEELAAAREEAQRAQQEYEAVAEDLAGVRADASHGFVEALAGAVGELAMEHARFEVAAEMLAIEEWTDSGPQRIEFLFAPGAEQPARPLSRIASGGEVSRVMLALKGVLGTADDVPVLVFDEVDAGIGGSTALSVGERLRGLAQTHQVLVVTHLAQVAAMASRHLVVEKSSTAAGVSTSVREVSGEERTSEIARMLSGKDSEAGLVHARELLEAASEQRG